MSENNDVIIKMLGKGPYNPLQVMRFIQSRLCLKCQLPLKRVGLMPNEGGIMLEGCSVASH